MSTNEELASAVQMGEQDKLLALWDAVRPFAAKTARRWAAAAGDRSGVTLDDLQQEAFLALLDALEGWRADDGAFLTWYGLRLKAAFTAACGLRTRRQAQEPLRNSTSLAAPIGDAENDLTLEDTISDPRADQDFLDVETQVWREQLHSTLEEALGKLPAQQSNILRRRFYQRQTLKQIADAESVGVDSIRRWQDNGLRALRKRKDLQSFVELRTPYYRRWSVQSLERTVEMIALMREQLEYEAAKTSLDNR